MKNSLFHDWITLCIVSKIAHKTLAALIRFVPNAISHHMDAIGAILIKNATLKAAFTGVRLELVATQKIQQTIILAIRIRIVQNVISHPMDVTGVIRIISVTLKAAFMAVRLDLVAARKTQLAIILAIHIQIVQNVTNHHLDVIGANSTINAMQLVAFMAVQRVSIAIQITDVRDNPLNEKPLH